MSFADKMKKLLGQHSGKARQGIEKAGDMIDKKTGGKYASHVDKAQQRAGKSLDDLERDQARREGRGSR
ncbi:antitoxin [Actinomadura craniellae]|uniref:Antitoxin n=1 Tax=Actinomadura craniellae TaxID=2231787 RepID=A0A365GZ32_9ACTN|nr:antitoxin [Actinomadura craniellae]RAY12028.1 antitoxin [Actinomadura craniellae]